LVARSLVGGRHAQKTRFLEGTGSCVSVPGAGAVPHGTLRAGRPARLAGNVHTSARYIARGSSTRSPIGNATVGLVGVAMTSTFENAASKSRAITVRALSARR
jgi:hypothetical protein